MSGNDYVIINQARIGDRLSYCIGKYSWCHRNQSDLFFCRRSISYRKMAAKKRGYWNPGKKDYIAYPKANGYRRLHLIIQFTKFDLQGVEAEIQIRTIAIDFWATLEHQIKYKGNVPHEKTIRRELKRCADEIASVDLSMQTIRDILQSDTWKHVDERSRWTAGM